MVVGGRQAGSTMMDDARLRPPPVLTLLSAANNGFQLASQ